MEDIRSGMYKAKNLHRLDSSCVQVSVVGPCVHVICLHSANADRRLMLFYLANDVLQNSRRRGASMFLELFRDPLRQAVALVR